MLYVTLKTWGLTEENLTLKMKEAYQEYWPRKIAKENPSEITKQDLYGVSRSERLTYEEAMGMQRGGWEMELEPHSELTQITKMREPHMRWNWHNDATPEDMMAGRAVQITIPDLGLMLIDEVTNLDDCCTDQLQGFLNNGWRILAVCPPCAQRRPDYILGRRKVKE